MRDLKAFLIGLIVVISLTGLVLFMPAILIILGLVGLASYVIGHCIMDLMEN